MIVKDGALSGFKIGVLNGGTAKEANLLATARLEVGFETGRLVKGMSGKCDAIFTRQASLTYMRRQWYGKYVRALRCRNNGSH